MIEADEHICAPKPPKPQRARSIKAMGSFCGRKDSDFSPKIVRLLISLIRKTGGTGATIASPLDIRQIGYGGRFPTRNNLRACSNFSCLGEEMTVLCAHEKHHPSRGVHSRAGRDGRAALRAIFGVWDIIGDTLVRQHGQALLILLRRRHLAQRLRHTAATGVADSQTLAGWTVTAPLSVRAFTVYFHLANIASRNIVSKVWR